MGVGVQFHALTALLLGKTLHPLYRRLGGPQAWAGQVQKISPPPGFEPQTVHPVASCYTDYAVLSQDLYRGINEFENGYSFITKLVKHMNDDLLGDLHRISDMLKNYLCQLLKVHEGNVVRETETQPLKLRWLLEI